MTDRGPGIGDGATRVPTVVAMCGLPFAGKSTLAREIAARLGADLIEIDALLSSGALSGTGAIPDAAWSAAYRRGEALLRESLRVGHRAVYDGVNFRAVMRAKLRRIAQAEGGELLVVQVTTPDAIIAARRAGNRVVPTRGDVDDPTFEMVRARFQPPGPDEWTVRFDGSEPVAAWVEQVFGAEMPGTTGPFRKGRE